MADRTPSLSHLSTFATVLKLGRLSRASERLRRSPSAVSRSIDILEAEFGRPLLARSQRGVSATPEGALVAARCEIIQAELSGLREQLVQAHGGQLRAHASVFQMHVDVSRLRAMIAVHDFGSVQRASQLLAISQPAVSLSIRHLETGLGVRLFSRAPTGMIATPAGVAGALCFKRVLSELRKMRDDVDSCDGSPSGVVSVGGLAYSRRALLPETIKRTLSSYPRIVVRTVEGAIGPLLGAMHAGEIDLLICARPNPALLEGVAVEPLVEDRMGLFVSRDHPLAQRRALPAEEVLRHPFILPQRGSVTRELLDQAFARAAGRAPQGAVETGSESIIRYLVLHAQLICFRSITAFDPETAPERIVPLDLGFELPQRSICLLQRSGVRQTAAVNEFLDLVRQIASSRAAA
jgi:LysR family transcriptional regulator of gallate degradation